MLDIIRSNMFPDECVEDLTCYKKLLQFMILINLFELCEFGKIGILKSPSSILLVEIIDNRLSISSMK